jgi:hypothetical protein
MKLLAVVLLTAVVTAYWTNALALSFRDEKYASLLWTTCPQLISHQQGAEVAFIEFPDGSFVPVRPRTNK